MVVQFVTPLSFDHVSTIPKNAPVKLFAIGHFRLRHAGITPGPILGMQLLKPAPGVAASVGRVIPSTVVHDAPSHKLRSGIMAVPVVVEKIRNCKTPDDHCVPIDRARSAELVLFAFEGLA